VDTSSVAPTATPFDLVVAGGRVIDPARGIDAVLDVAVAAGRIAAIGADLATGAPVDDVNDVVDVVDARGLVVTPGLIDLHTHVYPGLGNFCVGPDEAGVDRGVPVVVDGGTSGTATINLAKQWLDASAPKTKVLAFIDPNALYLATHDFICHKLEIANDARNIDLDGALAAIDAHPGFVVGFKVRACYTDDPAVSPFLEAAKTVAGERPIMVHLGRFPHTPTIDTSTLLHALRPGDVITHAFRGASGVLGRDDGKPTEAFADAVLRGVRLDVGHSATDFRFRDARRLIDAGYAPDSISTDLNIFNIDHPVGSLPETMSKIWALGFDLTDVVAMTTVNPARTIHQEHELGTLAVGRPAEISVLRIEDGPVPLSDGFETIEADRALVPVGCVRAGRWIRATAGLGAHAG
jgi:dihydroorotase